MTLEAIVIEILEATAVATLDELTALVAAHHAYTGKTRGRALKTRIRRILQRDGLAQHTQTHGSYVELKLGRFTGRIDLS